MSRYTPPKSSEPEPSGLRTLEPMRTRRPVVFWIVILAVAAMVLTTVGSFVTLLLT